MFYEINNTQYMTETDVVKLGFTKGLIKKYLPDPILKSNIYHKYGPKMHLYKVEEVESLLENEECKEDLEKAKLRRKVLGEKRREINEIKREKLYTLQYAIQDGDELKMLDCCDVISHEVLEGIKNLIGLETIDKYMFDELIYQASEKEANL